MDEVDELLREWAHFFRDRKNLESCRSIEHRYKPHSDDYATEGWGDMEAAPQTTKRSYALLRALETHEAVMQLPKTQKWALTYHFCYPHLPRGMVLRVMKKWIGRHISWKTFQEQVEIGRCRVCVLVKR
jgi:hypothetical protein